MMPGDLVKIFTVSNTHVEKGSIGVVTKKSILHPEWWFVYVLVKDEEMLFHREQLEPFESDIEDKPVNLHKSYWFTEKP